MIHSDINFKNMWKSVRNRIFNLKYLLHPVFSALIGLTIMFWTFQNLLKKQISKMEIYLNYISVVRQTSQWHHLTRIRKSGGNSDLSLDKFEYVGRFNRTRTSFLNNRNKKINECQAEAARWSWNVNISAYTRNIYW